jgi:hypothetical protein
MVGRHTLGNRKIYAKINEIMRHAQPLERKVQTEKLGNTKKHTQMIEAITTALRRT